MIENLSIESLNLLIKKKDTALWYLTFPQKSNSKIINKETKISIDFFSNEKKKIIKYLDKSKRIIKHKIIFNKT